MTNEFSSNVAGSSVSEPDSTLMDLVAQGDEEALASLFKRHSRLVYGVALRVLRSPPAAEDVLQEVFLQIWRAPVKCQSAHGDLRTWLAVVSRNRSIDALRKIRPTDPIEETPLASLCDLAQEAERHILMERVREIVATLPEEQRHALDLAFFEGCSHAEIAERLNHPLGTVKTRIRAAVRKLHEALNA